MESQGKSNGRTPKTCQEVFEKAVQELAEFNPRIIEGRFVIYGSTRNLDFVYNVDCNEEGKLLLMTGIPGFFTRLPDNKYGKKLLELILEAAGNEFLMFSKLQESLLIVEPLPVTPSIDEIRRFFSLSVLMVIWLSEQLDKVLREEEPSSFSVEEAAKLITGNDNTE